MGLEARQAAVRALDWVLREGRMLAHLPNDARLAPADDARAGRLVSLTLRHLGPLDACIAPYLDRKPHIASLILLRLAAAELLVAGEDAHGVVDSAVQMAKHSRATERKAGMINAVLRKVAVEGPERFADLPPQQMPGWIGGPVKKRHGLDTLRAIEAAHVALPPTDLTVKSGMTLDVPGAVTLATGSLRVPAGTQITTLPGYDTGAFWVQDAAAALPVRLLGAVAGARVLDLCAAPGGKTMQLAAMGANVTAVDVSQTRMDRVAQNLKRTGLTAELIVADAFDHTSGPYDAILLDAPCTASGTIRRHPDLPHVKQWTEVEPLTRLQMRLIDHALTLLAPGGRLVFCTCSLLPVEGEHQVTAALKRHEGLAVIPADATALGGDPSWQSPEGGLRLRPDFWPGIGGIDGFYMAALTRP